MVRLNGGFIKWNAEYAKAIADYNEVIQRAPKHAEAYRRRGEAWHHLKEEEKANADWRIAKELEMESTSLVGV